MIESKLSKLGGEVTRASLFLTRNLGSSITLERSLEKKSLDLKRKIVEDRGRILKRIGSRDRDSERGGLLGGALGLLGIGGGGGLLRRGLRRTPNSPSQLLRMQRGTSSLSRVGRLGRLARPIAAVGTGLDFIQRRAQGQTNVQAGVGAAGGLAGSIAFAKGGALLGTAIAGPLGTAVGGVGGAIIGSLAGGRIADLFTGANRRRRFEEERTIVRTQKTLFSDALDDFDKVLDKFEDVAPALVLRRGGDDEEVVGSRRPKLPSPIPFFQRPAVKTTGRVLLASGLMAFLAFQLKKGRMDVKTYTKILELVKRKPASFQKLPLEKQLGILKKEVRVINKTNRKRNPVDGGFFARRRVTKESQKIKTEKLLKKKDPKADKLRKQAEKNKEMEEKFIRETGFDTRSDPSRYLNNAKTTVSSAKATLERLVPNFFKTGQVRNLGADQAAIDKFNRQISGRLQDLLKLERNMLFNKKDIPRSNQLLRRNFDAQLDGIRKAINYLEDILDDITRLDPKLRRTIPKGRRIPIKKILRDLKKKDDSILRSSNDLNSLNSTDIAMADLTPKGSIFVINQAPSKQVNILEDTDDIAMIGGTENSFSALNKYAEFTSVAFTT